MKLKPLIKILGVVCALPLALGIVGCKAHHRGRAKVIRMSDGERAFKMGDDWFWNAGTGDDWVKNDSYTPWTCTKARPVSDKEEELDVEVENPEDLEVNEADDPGTGADVGTAEADAAADADAADDGGGDD